MFINPESSILLNSIGIKPSAFVLQAHIHKHQRVAMAKATRSLKSRAKKPQSRAKAPQSRAKAQSIAQGSCQACKLSKGWKAFQKKAAAEKPLKAKKGAAFAKNAMKAMKAMRAKKAKKGGEEGGEEGDEGEEGEARRAERAIASGQGFSPSRPPPAGREAFSPYSWASTLSPAYSYSSCFRHLSDDDDHEN